MYIDSQLQFATAQALTATAVSTNLIDLGVARNLFDGEPLAVLIVPSVSADITTGDETYGLEVQTSVDAAFTSPVSLQGILPIPAAKLASGSTYVFPLPVGANVLQFLRLKWTLGGTTPTLTYAADLLPLNMVQKYISYKDNSTIS